MHAYIQDLSIPNFTFSGPMVHYILPLSGMYIFRDEHTRIVLRSTCTWLWKMLECFKVLSKIINHALLACEYVNWIHLPYGRSSDDLCEQGTVNSGTIMCGKFLDIFYGWVLLGKVFDVSTIVYNIDGLQLLKREYNH